MIWALLATTLAGAATVLGGLLVLHPGLRRPAPLAVGLAFAAGLMVVLSVGEILPVSLATLRTNGVAHAPWWTLGAGLAGVAAVLLIDRLLPGHTGHVSAVPEAGSGLAGDARLLRSGLLIALVIGAHNLPEGLMTFLAMLESPELGVGLAVAIAIHNVPEGMVVAAPVYAATGRRGRALLWAAVAGLAEPVGAVVGYLVLRAVMPEELLVLTLALVAGMMLALSVRELVPAARRYRTHWSQPPLGFLAGGAVVWASLQLF